MRAYYSLYGRLLSLPVLTEAFRQVKRNRGAPGVDGQTLTEFEANLEVELSCLLNELQEKRYQAQPVRRVVLIKPEGGNSWLGFYCQIVIKVRPENLRVDAGEIDTCLSWNRALLLFTATQFDKGKHDTCRQGVGDSGFIQSCVDYLLILL